MGHSIIGHRGNGRTINNPFAEGKAPQHTLRSFRQAIDSGADGVEFDVFLTRDNIPVIDDDGFLNGKKLSSLFNDEVRMLSRSGVDYVPTLDETLRSLSDLEAETDRKLIIDIELKGPSVVEPTLRVVKEAMATTSLRNEQFIFFSGDRDKVSLLRELDADVQIQPSVRTSHSFAPEHIQMPGYHVDQSIKYSREMISDLRSYLIERNCHGVDMPMLDIREELTDLAGELGISISTYPSGPRRIDSLPILDKSLCLLETFSRYGGDVIIKSDDIPATRAILAEKREGGFVCAKKAERFMGLHFLEAEAGLGGPRQHANNDTWDNISTSVHSPLQMSLPMMARPK